MIYHIWVWYNDAVKVNVECKRGRGDLLG